ncbi:MAG: hypothetical protein DRN33_01945 [Thermoplasmata archaeon]|jgi:hypothetical protein|nr:MAG: hypothetical protein FE043_03435 [Thermoplasmata archaeon]RLF64560.1 MAG: hypothetical protein DRN33_01945 [Thermoplasmata archaeon]
MSEKKNLMADITFIFYVLIVLPAVSFVYFAYALTNLESIEVMIGAAILWAIMIPYPLYWYLKKKIKNQNA